ncbi:hypothetical protein BCR36DRAFT_409225 [Piromyces finnis]|uniref:AMP-activated protein kinase glycogen-binding domain-containing protein n=1 Tax=Piromyces finnis TaxID=1754191 RepID=A0A1Y1VK40_9FUNG|nr:hypothetical protein BCR36DRAFT_409225 [Piromyces finnis]|eukprot:ORX57748.1 hypothetical protein BCR36DRAFT_409225 [Piromyces finnis]
MFDYQFEWKNPHAGKVYVTGNFDNWQKTNELEKQPDGTFKKVIPLPSNKEKIIYKFVVDGNWVIDNSMPIEDDGMGNQNNCFNIPVEVTEIVAAAAEEDLIQINKQEEQERIRLAEEERLKKEQEEQERIRLAEEERLKKEQEEQERIRLAEEERLKKEQEEQERIRLAEEERLKKEQEEQERIRLAEEERLKKEQEEQKLRMKQLEDIKKLLSEDNDIYTIRERNKSSSKQKPISRSINESLVIKKEQQVNESKTRYIVYGLTCIGILAVLIYILSTY